LILAMQFVNELPWAAAGIEVGKRGHVADFTCRGDLQLAVRN